MPATPNDLKNFFALSGNNPPVTNAQLTKLAVWLGEQIGKDPLLGPADADDFVDFVYQTTRQAIVHRQRAKSAQAF